MDRIVIAGEQLCSEVQRIAHAQANLDMGVAREREMEQRRMRNPSCHTSSSSDDVWHVVLGQQVIDPFLRGVYRKCCNCNVIEPHKIILFNEECCASPLFRTVVPIGKGTLMRNHAAR
jgi:hypothetical protein